MFVHSGLKKILCAIEISDFSSELNYIRFFLQLCVILEPMQELMSRHKAYALSPRDCLKTTLFQKWQRIVAPPGKRGRRTVALHEKHQPVEPNGRPNRQREIGFCYPRNDAFVVDFHYLFATILGSTGFSLSNVSFSDSSNN